MFRDHGEGEIGIVPGMSRLTGNHQKPEHRHRTDFSLETSEGTNPADCDFGILVSRTVRE